MADPIADAQAGYAQDQQAAVLPPTGGTQVAGVGGQGTFWERALQAQMARQAATSGNASDLLGGFDELIAQAGGEIGGATGDDELKAWIERLRSDPAELLQTQMKLFMLGMYPQGTEPRFGVLDPTTIRVIAEFSSVADLSRGDREYEDELDRMDPAGAMARRLQQQTQALVGQLGPGGAGAAEIPPMQVVLQDPQALAGVLDAAYAQAGMRARPGDRRAFILAFHALQRDNAEAEFRYREQLMGAAPGEIVERVAMPSAEGMAQTFAREQLGDEPFVAKEGADVVDVLRQTIAQG